MLPSQPRPWGPVLIAKHRRDFEHRAVEQAQKAGDGAHSPSLNSASPSYSSMFGSHGETHQKSRRRDSELFSCQHKGSKHSAVEGSGEAEWVSAQSMMEEPIPGPTGHPAEQLVSSHQSTGPCEHVNMSGNQSQTPSSFSRRDR